MGLFNFKKKPKVEETKKVLFELNRSTLLAEYRCPYCNCVLVTDHPRNIQKPESDECKECGHRFIL